MRTYKQFINGELVSRPGEGMIDVENPSSGQIMAQVPDGGAEDAQAALEAARAAQDAWAALPAPTRATALKKLAEGIRGRRTELAAILAEEQAKTLPLAQVEVDFTAEYFDYYAGWARIYEGEIIQSDRPRENILLYRQPIGVVAGICPWNFPLFVTARKVAPSLLAGCAVVVKPSSVAPVTVMEFAKIAAGLDLPRGILNVVTGGGARLGEALAKSPLTDMVSLTGSVEAGQRIITAGAANITKVSLELGGKAPAIVCADADLDLAAKAVTASRVIFSGQVCNCARALPTPLRKNWSGLLRPCAWAIPLTNPRRTCAARSMPSNWRKLRAWSAGPGPTARRRSRAARPRTGRRAISTCPRSCAIAARIWKSCARRSSGRCCPC